MNIINSRYGELNIIEGDTIVSRSMILYGEWAQHEINLLSHFIRPGYVIADVGAFIGTHARAFSSFIGTSGQVLAFEPRKVAFEILKKNEELAPLANIFAINSALGDVEKILTVTIPFVESSENYGALKLEQLFNAVDCGEKITVTTLDAYKLDRLNFVKIDVEGMELDVLNGAIDTLQRCKPVVFAECNSLENSAPIIKWCQENNYQVYGVLSAAYNLDNYARNTENIFGAAKEVGMLLIPGEAKSQYEDVLIKERLPEINTTDDLALLLLHKPQYPDEVLANSKVAAMLTLSYPSLQSNKLTQLLAERDEQITTLNQSIAERDEQITTLNQSIAERDEQITTLNQSIVERDGQITNLIQAFVKRDRQITTLNQIVAERDGQISRSQQLEKGLQTLIVELRNGIDACRSSTSWRITRPLREVSLLWQQLSRFMRLTRQFADALKKGEGKELKNIIFLHECIRATALPKIIPSAHNVLMLEDVVAQDVDLPSDVAVHTHVYYPDMAPEIRGYLENIPVCFHLYVTTDTPEKAKEIELVFSALPNVKALDIHITENRGRDIFPMLVAIGAKLAKHQLVLHIHSQRSPQDSMALGGWRRYLMESLLGNSQRIVAIFQQFMMDKNLGILFPNHYHPVKQFVNMPGGYNDDIMERLLVRSGKKREDLGIVDRTFFPSGDMFWFRGKAILPFVKMKLSAEDFEPEEGQFNQTLAYAIERMYPYFASEMGLLTKSYLANTFLSQDCSAHKLDLFQTFQSRGLIVNPTILFDHNGGGGTNIYTADLVKDINKLGNSVLRIYPFDEGWILQWLGDGDGMLFYTSSIEELYKVLASSCSTSIIINSLYGHPDIKVSASNIVGLVRKLRATLDIKIHDFNALCPSPHLIDYEGKYCGVPKDFEICSRCLQKNHGWYHSWIPEENKAIDIAAWRKPFAELFAAATMVTFFDSSSIEIVRQAFYIESCKVKIIPHTINYFKCDNQMDLSGPLHIGIIGALSKAKGGDIVNALYQHIVCQGIHIPITLVGPSYIELPPSINVHGNYAPNDLPIVISKQAINVILMPSIVPETFSYTISEAMAMGLPIVAFDIGAQGNRVKQYELGRVVPLGSPPDVILTAIQSALIAA